MEDIVEWDDNVTVLAGHNLYTTGPQQLSDDSVYPVTKVMVPKGYQGLVQTGINQGPG